ncbi:uncharacterized protein LOC122378744 [Amphibalanus amphitrite]|uniref:uncharacterized protein LOC122378744 n=1 Tax=Amphibalanus amphitrite TaxID=1232801 RepID=UPI001C91DF96|nr:uncharacterized protein LOC122378744 [Amphibalanus amphitrite]
MAAPVGSAMLLSWMALLGLLGTATAFFREFSKPTVTSLCFLDSNSCVPANFTSELPTTVTDAVSACMPRRRFGRSPAWGRRSSAFRLGGKTDKLSCIATQLNITSDTGVDAAALDTVIESLSSNTTFTDQLKASADSCIAAMNTTLTAEQQRVYVLTCLKLSQKSDCKRQDENTTLCLNAKTLVKCPLGIQSLVDLSTFFTCKMQAKASIGISMFTSIFSGDFSSSSISDSLCPTLEEGAKAAANCSLQAAGLASGDTVDLTAVQTAITASATTTDSEKALQQTVLSTCQANGADTVDAFLDCWATESVDGCVTSIAERLATGSTSRRTGRMPGRRRSGGGRRRFSTGGRRRFSGSRRSSRRTGLFG